MNKTILALVLASLTVPAFAKNDGHSDKQKHLPPGLEKKLERTGELPPGWQKKVRKGEVLDLDLYEIGKRNRYEDAYLKPDVGTEILRIENRIIRIRKDTREILDILGL